MRKSGLQKQISFIFNDMPAPRSDADVLQPSQQNEPVKDLLDEPPSEPSAVEPIETINTPAIPRMRPKPLPRIRSQQSGQKTRSQLSAKMKKIATGGSEGKIDGRQKKMAMLVGFLSVVLAGVLFISLGGLGQQTAASKEPTTPEPQAKSVKESAIDMWQMPESLPADMRNPTQTITPVVDTDETDEDTGAVDRLAVTGIVFSKENPLAVIDGKYVRQGDTINGVTVVAINRNSVEFEKDKKRWTQQVRH